MAVSFNNSGVVTLTTSPQLIIAAGGAQSAVITRATMANNGGVAHNVTVYSVYPGNTPGAANIVVAPSGVPGTLQPGQSIALPLTGHNLVNGQGIYAAVDSGSDVTMSISVVLEDNS